MKFTIIITAYNCQEYIQQSILSCINQTYSDIEILVYDDASEDNTSKIVTELTIEHHNVKLYTSSENMGALFGRHLLVNEKATGDVVCFLGGDDYLTTDCISNLVRYYDEDTLMTYGNWRTPTGKPFEVKAYSDQVFKDKSFRRSGWRATALNTFRIGLLKAVPEYLLVNSLGHFYDNCTDLAYSFPCLEMSKQHQVKVVKEATYIYRSKHDNTTLNRLGFPHKIRIREALKSKPIIQKYYDKIQNERILEQQKESKQQQSKQKA